MFAVVDKRAAQARSIGELPVREPGLATQAAYVPAQTFDPSVIAYEPLEPGRDEKPFDLAPMATVWGQFKREHAASAAAQGFLKPFKDLLPRVPGMDQARVLTLNSEVVATYRFDGRLNESKLKKEQPELYFKFMRTKSVQVFDEEAFRDRHPELHEVYRGRSIRLKKSSGGIVLPS